MYLRGKNIHPSVLAVMESQGKRRLPSQQPARKVVPTKTISESVICEGVDDNGKKLIIEVEQTNPLEDLVIPLNKQYAFVLNEHEHYELMRVDEGLGDMIRGAVNGFKKMWAKFKAGLAKLFGKPGEMDSFLKKYNQDPANALGDLKKHLLAKGIDPKEVDKTMEKVTKSLAKGKDMKEQIQKKDPGVLASMKAIGDAKTPEEEQAAKEKANQEHEVRMAQINSGNPVVAGGPAGPAGKAGADGKDAKAAAPPAPTPAPAPDPNAAAATPAPAATAAAAATPDPAAGAPKAGDKVEKTDASGKKMEGEVITVDEAGAKKWNEQFAGKSGFVGIKAGLNVKTASGFFPLDKDWTPASAADPNAAPAAVPATAAVTTKDAAGNPSTGTVQTDQDQLAAMAKSMNSGTPATVNGDKAQLAQVTAQTGDGKTIDMKAPEGGLKPPETGLTPQDAGNTPILPQPAAPAPAPAAKASTATTIIPPAAAPKPAVQAPAAKKRPAGAKTLHSVKGGKPK
jgi:hypothetical protein